MHHDVGQANVPMGVPAQPCRFPRQPATGNEWIDGARDWVIRDEIRDKSKGDRPQEIWGDTLTHLTALLPGKTETQISEALYDQVSPIDSEIVHVKSMEITALTKTTRPAYEIVIEYHLKANVFGLDISEHRFEMVFHASHEEVAKGINPRFTAVQNK
jgi:hypothetical protein